MVKVYHERVVDEIYGKAGDLMRFGPGNSLGSMRMLPCTPDLDTREGRILFNRVQRLEGHAEAVELVSALGDRLRIGDVPGNITAFLYKERELKW